MENVYRNNLLKKSVDCWNPITGIVQKPPDQKSNWFIVRVSRGKDSVI